MFLLYVRYFMSILVLQSSWWGSWLLCLICLPGVSWWLSGSSSQCHGVVCGLWLWYFLIILTYYFWPRIPGIGPGFYTFPGYGFYSFSWKYREPTVKIAKWLQWREHLFSVVLLCFPSVNYSFEHLRYSPDDTMVNSLMVGVAVKVFFLP